MSAEDNIKINTLKNEIRRQLASHPTLSGMIGIEIPISWQEIRIKLKQLKDEFDQHELSKPDYTRLCTEEGIDEKSSGVLLEYMHVTGDVFFYTESERLNDTIIIDPKWALDRIYELLDDEIAASGKNSPGEFTINRVHQKLERFSEDKRLDILELLKKFELIFEKPEDPETFIAPQYLPEKPDQAKFNNLWDSNEDPILVYKYPKYVHPSIMVQFMSRFGEFSEPLNYWKNGIILRKNGVRVLVEHPKNSLKVTVTVEKRNFCPIRI
ncbi:MAG: COR domain-containing protein [Balneolaceae bacterium]|nr:COR domain-containing protein [Balneolaceae bacterium]